MELIKNTNVALLSVAVIMTFVSGCQSNGTAGSASTASSSSIVLAPAETPAEDKVGTQVHVLKNGVPVTYSVTAVDSDTYSGADSDGCTYNELSLAYAPSLKWENCTGSTGTQTITKTKGSPWPMSVGSKFSYKFYGSDNKDSWSATRKCEVTGTEHVSTQLGSFDTYKVVCKDPWSKRTWWYAPEIGRNVKSNRKHYRDSSRSYDIETIKIMDGV